MSSFDKAMGDVLKNEGGYVKDPIDRGGETIYGVSRRYWPSWAGWAIVDQMLKGTGTVQPSERLDLAVKDFYRAEFWDRCNCDALPQGIATKVFDTAVNVGVTTACRWLQESLNILNRNGKSYPDIEEDGKLGPATLRSLKALINLEGDCKLLLTAFHFRQGMHYWEQMKKSPVQEKFARGWFARAEEK